MAELSAAEPEAALAASAGWAGRVVRVLAVAVALYALYWVVAIVEPQLYRVSFLLIALVMAFLATPALRQPPRDRAHALDWALAAASAVVLAWPILDRADFPYRAAVPTPIDLFCGGLATLLVLEAARRTAGWPLPLTAAAFVAYAYLGPLFDLVGLPAIAHRGYYPDRLIGTLYMTLDGLFGVPLEVAATYIILFSIYGAVLEKSGAGTFFLDFAMSLSRHGQPAKSAGRSVTLAGFLLGTVSGSGVEVAMSARE